MRKKLLGAATLVITVILILVALLTMMYATKFSTSQQRTAANQYAAAQALEAAQAGLDFGLQYLSANSGTVLASASGGWINYGASDTNLTNVTLSNNSKYSVVYTNPVVSDYTTLAITVTGTSADGTASRIVTQQVHQQQTTSSYTSISLGNVIMVGGSQLNNLITNLNLGTAGSVTLNNGASTNYTGGSSSQGNIKSDIQQNLSAYQGMSEPAFFQVLFGQSEATVASSAQASGSYYSNIGPNYSNTLNGQTNTTIFISQTNGTTVSIGQGTRIGTAFSPVALIVEGNLTIDNGTRIYGFIYAGGTLTLAGGARIDGGIASAGNINISNGVRVDYAAYPTLIGGSLNYAKIPGSWRDF